MKRNMGTVDRALRTFAAARVLIVLSLAVFGIGSVLGIVALVVAGIMLTTSAVGYCRLYTPFGISTATMQPLRPRGHRTAGVEWSGAGQPRFLGGSMLLEHGGEVMFLGRGSCSWSSAWG